MDAQAVVAVSGSIVMFLQVLKAGGLEGRWALVVCAFASTAGVLLWGYSAGTLARETLWQYGSGWIAVFSSAAGLFNIVRNAPEAVTSIRGAGTALVAAVKGKGGDV